MSTKKFHPYSYSNDKNFVQIFFDFAVPVTLFFLFFYFYNFGKATPSEMVKTFGLLSITLLALTLLVGPLAAILPFFNFLKAHRKIWGISSFLAGLIHGSLVYIYFFKFDLLKFVDSSNPKFFGLLSGVFALTILALVTFTSNKFALSRLSPKTWKLIQNMSYLALILAVSHFYLEEAIKGVLVIKRLLGQITFGFAGLVILTRIAVLILPKKK